MSTLVNNPVTRVGDSLNINGTVARGGPTPVPYVQDGVVEILIDGQVVSTGAVGLANGNFAVSLVAGPDALLNDLAPGQHVATAHFLGTHLYRASVSAPFTFTLAPWVGDRLEVSTARGGRRPCGPATSYPGGRR